MERVDLTFGNSVREIIVAGSIAAGVLVLVWGLRAVAMWKLRRAGETQTRFDDILLDVVSRTKLFLLFLPAVFLGARALDVPDSLYRMLRVGATIGFAAQLAFWTTGFIESYIVRYRRMRLESDPDALTTLNVFRIGAIAVAWIAISLTALHHLGINIATLIAGLGIGGIAVALATQNILGDLFASLSIVIDKPFVIGDFVIVGETMGTIEHVGLKSTQIRSLSGEQIIVGNADLLRSRIRNYRRMAERRVVLKFGVTYQTTATQLQRIPELVRGAVEARERVRFDRSHLTGFGDSALDIESVYWVLSADYNEFADIHQAICLEIVRAFESEGIAFAYPTRTLFVTGP